MLKFGELQSKRLHRFITYKLDNNYKEIVVDQVGDRGASYEDFTNSLPENDCRYAIYDFDFVTAEDVQKSRIFYILWYCFPTPLCLHSLSSVLAAKLLTHENITFELQGPQPPPRLGARCFTPAQTKYSRMGSMAFRWSCRLPMLVKSALMRSRIEQNRRRLCVSEIPHRGLVPTTVDLYAIIDLVL